MVTPNTPLLRLQPSSATIIPPGTRPRRPGGFGARTDGGKWAGRTFVDPGVGPAGPPPWAPPRGANREGDAKTRIPGIGRREFRCSSLPSETMMLKKLVEALVGRRRSTPALQRIGWFQLQCELGKFIKYPIGNSLIHRMAIGDPDPDLQAWELYSFLIFMITRARVDVTYTHSGPRTAATAIRAHDPAGEPQVTGPASSYSAGGRPELSRVTHVC